MICSMLNAKPWRTWIWSAAGALALAGSLAAQPPVSIEPLDALSEEVRALVLQADGHLRRQEWEQARGLLQGLLAGNSDRNFWRGSSREPLWRLAVAEAGLGRAEEARWHWQAVDAFGTLPSQEDLAPYGEAAQLLVRTVVRKPGAAPAGLEVDRGPGLVPARRVQGEALDLARLQEGAPPIWALVELVIDAEGRVREPVVLDTSSAALAYQVFEAVRGWRYEPARRDGRPVAALLQLGVNSPQEVPLADVLTPTGLLAEIDKLLLAGKWQQARRRGDVVWSTALHNAQQTPQAFALLLTLRALAEAGAGKNELAICHWQAAQGLAPQLFHADLAAYGAAGALLEANRWGYPIQPATAEPQPVREGSRMTRPQIRTRPEPEIPRVSRKAGTRAIVILESVIEKSGAIGQPFVLGGDLGDQPNFAASGLDALCRWQFSPATHEGEPMRAYYTLTINFQVKG